MIDNARYITRYTKDKRTAELYEISGGYVVRFIHDRVIKEDRVIKDKSVYYVVDACENWCEGIIDPWI